MIKKSLIIGFVISIPMFVISTIGSFLLEDGVIPELALVGVDNYLILTSLLFVSGIPIYFYLKDSKHDLYEMMSIIAVSCIIKSLFNAIYVVLSLPGSNHAIPPSTLFYYISVVKVIFILILISVLLALIIRKLFEKVPKLTKWILIILSFIWIIVGIEKTMIIFQYY